MKTAEEIYKEALKEGTGYFTEEGIAICAMQAYASQFIDAAAKSIHPFENGEKRKVMCNSILKLKDQLK